MAKFDVLVTHTTTLSMWVPVEAKDHSEAERKVEEQLRSCQDDAIKWQKKSRRTWESEAVDLQVANALKVD